jgi:hypothetical protein
LGTAGEQKEKKGASGPQLYNLADDIGEAKNVAAEHADVVERLKALAKSMDGDLGQNGIGAGCRAMGRVGNPKPLIDDEGNVREGFVGGASRLP